MSGYSEYRARVKEAGRNLSGEFKRWRDLTVSGWQGRTRTQKAIGIAALCAGGALAWTLTGPLGLGAVVALETLTAVSFASNQAISRGVQDTKQKQVLFTIPNFSTGLQSLLTGAYGRALMGLNGIVQNVILSATPDRVLDAKNEDGSSKKRRFKLGLAFSTVGIAGSAAFAAMTSLWEVVPMVAGLLVTSGSVMASSMHNKGNRDPQIRALSGLSQGLMSIYSALHAGLFLKMSTDLMDAHAHTSAIMKFHVPVLDEEGRKISVPSRVKLAFRKVALLEEQSGFTPIQLAHPNKAQEAKLAEFKAQGLEMSEPLKDQRTVLFDLWSSDRLTEAEVRESYNTWVDAQSLNNDETLLGVWGVAQRDRIKDVYPLKDILNSRVQKHDGLYTETSPLANMPAYSHGQHPSATLA